MATVGALIFEMSANVARLQQDMAKARSTVDGAMQDIAGAAKVAKVALESVGAAFSVHAVASMIEGAIEGVVQLGRLADQAGVTVEALSSLEPAARRSGTGMDQVATAMNKLEKGMLEFATTGKGKAAQALEALGFSQAQVTAGLKDMGPFLQQVAQRLIEMDNGGQRAAYAQLLMGKAGAANIPFLRELAEAQKLHARLTEEQREAAKRLEDEWIGLKLNTEQLKREMGLGLTPALTDVTQAFIDLKGKQGDFTGFWDTIGTGIRYSALAVGSFWLGLKDMGDGIGAVSAQTAALLHGDLALFKEIGRLRDEESKKNEEAFNKFQDRLLNPPPLPEPKKIGSEKNIPIVDLAAEGGAGRLSPYDQEWNKLIDMLRKVESEGSVAAQVLHSINEGDFGKVTDAERKQLLNLAARVEYTKQAQQLQKEMEEGGKRLAEELYQAEKHQAVVLDEQARHWKDIIDPIEPYRRELEQIDKLLEAGKLTQEEWAAATFHVQDAIDKANKGVAEQVKKTDNFARDMGLTFESAFENAMVKGKSFRDVLAGIDQDIARIILRQTVTVPLGNAVSDFISSSGISDIFSGIFGGGKAAGGPVSGGTSYLVGERGPEIFTPGSSGSITPNGAGGDTNVTFHIASLDPRTAASVIIQNREVITDIVRQASNRRGVATAF